MVGAQCVGASNVEPPTMQPHQDGMMRLADTDEEMELTEASPMMSKLRPPSSKWRREEPGRARSHELQDSESEASVLPELPGVSLSFRDLAFSLPISGGGQKRILEPCSGSFEPGQLVAIMGPSGCGKTTLLDMLAMKKTSHYTGQVYVNGHPRQGALFRRVAAYVGIDDAMPQHWQVREAVEFNFRLKQQKRQSRAASAAFVDLILETFGLTDVSTSYLGGTQLRGISSGQRRRVSLARGLAAQAPLLFCDEPTSGLSATDAEHCVKALRGITERMNFLAVVVIHQPRAEVVRLFDTLMLLTSDPGRTVYLGPMSQVSAHFAECGCDFPPFANPADVFLDLVTPGAPGEKANFLVSCYEERLSPQVETLVQKVLDEPGQTLLDVVQSQVMEGRNLRGRVGLPPGPRSASSSCQVCAVVGRKARLTWRNPTAGAVALTMPCIVGLVLGSLFKGICEHSFLQQVPFFMALTTSSCLGSLGLMPNLIEERTYMKIETSEALYIEWVSALASFLVDVPIAIIGCSLQLMIIIAFSGMDHAYIKNAFGWNIYLFFFYDSLFACIAALAPDAQLAQLLATPLLTVFMLFNGFTVSKDAAPAWLGWIFEISPNFYAMQSIVTQVAADYEGEGSMVVEAFGFQGAHEKKGVLLMACGVVVFRIVQVLSLKYGNKIQK